MKRRPLNAFRKKKIEARVKKKFGRLVCEHCKKKPRSVNLEYAHKNRRNYDNRVVNFLLLCPTCHKRYDDKVKLGVHRYFLGVTRITRVKRKPKKKRRRKKRNIFNF